jgi:hypothetical protein
MENNTQNTTAIDKEMKTTEKERKAAIDAILALIASDAKKGVAMTVGEAGKLLAQVDLVLADLAEKVYRTDENAPLWSLDLTPVTVTVAGNKRQWIEVSGLDKNARVQLSDDGAGKVLVHVTPKKAKSAEAKAYFDAIVGATKDLTVAVTVRKAVAGRTFRQVWAVAQAQEQKRIEKKFADLCPPLVESPKVVKKAA